MEQSLTDGEEQHGSINVKLVKFPIVYNINASLRREGKQAIKNKTDRQTEH